MPFRFPALRRKNVLNEMMGLLKRRKVYAIALVHDSPSGVSACLDPRSNHIWSFLPSSSAKSLGARSFGGMQDTAGNTDLRCPKLPRHP
jgi:hypothetical protein